MGNQPPSGYVSQLLSNHFDTSVHAEFAPGQMGGCIGAGWRLVTDECSYFVKSSSQNILNGEMASLEVLCQNGFIRVPKPILLDAYQGAPFLVIEWLDLDSGGSASQFELMGQQLAAMHLNCTQTYFGFDCNNTIGSTPQINTPSEHWASFFVDRRLNVQFDFAQRNGASFPRRKEFMERVRNILEGHHPNASLLHGDLWSGNAAFICDGSPVIYDPATYYGDPETDLAMTRLFGGFPESFYRAYHEINPLKEGWEDRVTLYNLYHILNHFNIFGGSYLGQSKRMMQQLLG